MRMIGKMDNQQDATRFSDYVQTLGITVQTEPDGEEIALWNIDDDHLDQVKTELEQFRENPSETKYVQGAAQGQKIRNQEEKEQQKRQQNYVHVQRRWETPELNHCPVTIGLMAISILTVVFTSTGTSIMRLGDKQNDLLSKMRISEVKFVGGNRIQYHKLAVLRETHEYWRLVTPMFLHFSLLHILFNMLWMRTVGTITEHRIGSFRYLILVLLISAISNIGQFLWSGPMFGGMSGVVFGLIGFIWMRGKFDPHSGLFMPKEQLVILGIFQVLCLLGVLGPIANAAHMVGLAVGMIAGAGVPLIKNALK